MAKLTREISLPESKYDRATKGSSTTPKTPESRRETQHKIRLHHISSYDMRDVDLHEQARSNEQRLK